MRRLLTVVALLFAQTVWSGDLEDGLAAMERKEYTTALSKFRSAAEQGNAVAQYNLGEVYENGNGVKRDYKEALRWYLLAAKQGHAEAQKNIGKMYSAGRGVIQDYKQAVYWLKLAAKQGNDRAQYLIGLMYSLGNGLPKDFIRAHMWLNISAVNGDKDSLTVRDDLATDMSPWQVEQAQRMARECMNSNFKKCD